MVETDVERSVPAECPFVVMVCGDERCLLSSGAATGGSDVVGALLRELRAVIAGSRRGVLIRSACIRHCGEGVAVLVGRTRDMTLIEPPVVRRVRHFDEVRRTRAWVQRVVSRW